MPFVALTAYETPFENFRIDQVCDSGKSLLVIGGAGSVGSMAIQPGKWAGMRCCAEASGEARARRRARSMHTTATCVRRSCSMDRARRLADVRSTVLNLYKEFCRAALDKNRAAVANNGGLWAWMPRIV